ncbi:hypothetical protein MYCSP_19290 [Mycobacteroides saopaulense]|nr:hypothetical protein MYCSP_19290 [Mycobacteroides saopaulense]
MARSVLVSPSRESRARHVPGRTGDGTPRADVAARHPPLASVDGRYRGQARRVGVDYRRR